MSLPSLELACSLASDSLACDSLACENERHRISVERVVSVRGMRMGSRNRVMKMGSGANYPSACLAPCNYPWDPAITLLRACLLRVDCVVEVRPFR
jgi:hypothetical protein